MDAMSSSLSSCSSEHDAETKLNVFTETHDLYHDGPFATTPDPKAIKYLKDTSAEKWLNRYDPDGTKPSRSLLPLLGVSVPPTIQEDFAVKLLRKTMHRLEKLPQYNSVEDALRLLGSSRKIMILTGAGISVSCGIPDFRSPQGLYARLQAEGKYELDDPQQMFDIDYFKLYPEVFYSFASQIYPSNFVPSPCHRFVKLIETRGQLLRNYTQNIDNIEGVVGINRVFQCHGSFATASCIVCHARVPGSDIKEHIFSHSIPYCASCTKRTAALKNPRPKGKGKRKSGWDRDEDEGDDASRHIMKPDITFFGEKLASNFDELFLRDIRSEDFDCLLIIGTSLKVAPVADIIHRIPHSIPQILINKTPIAHARPDIALLGNADEIVEYLCRRLRWTLPSSQDNGSGAVAPVTEHLEEPRQIGDSHVWVFRGAEPGKAPLNSQSSTLSSLSSETKPPPKVKTTVEYVRGHKRPRHDYKS